MILHHPNRARIDQLAELELLRFCDRHELRRLAEVFRIRAVRQGEVLCRAGDEADSVYLVADGYLGVVVGGELVATLGRGALAGELAPLGAQARCADLHVMADGEVLEAPARELALLLAECQGLRKAVTPLLAERVEQSRRRASS